MRRERHVLSDDVWENFVFSGVLLVSATVSVLEGLDGLPKLSWLWTVIGPAVGLEVAEIGRASCRERGLISVVAVSLKEKVTVELKAPLLAAVMVGVPALVSP